MLRDRLVGARELKTRLGTYLRRVRNGETLVVTERGEPAAELRPIGPGLSGVDARLARLAARAVVTRRTRRTLPPFHPVPNRGRAVSDAVTEDRDERA